MLKPVNHPIAELYDRFPHHNWNFRYEAPKHVTFETSGDASITHGSAGVYLYAGPDGGTARINLGGIVNETSEHGANATYRRVNFGPSNSYGPEDTVPTDEDGNPQAWGVTGFSGSRGSQAWWDFINSQGETTISGVREFPEETRVRDGSRANVTVEMFMENNRNETHYYVTGENDAANPVDHLVRIGNGTPFSSPAFGVGSHDKTVEYVVESFSEIRYSEEHWSVQNDLRPIVEEYTDAPSAE